MRHSLTVVFLLLCACGDNHDNQAPREDAGVDGRADAAPDAPSACTVASDCNDNNACTTDTCNAAHQCEHAAKAVDDSIACTTDACDPATGTVSHTPVDSVCEVDGKTCTVATCSATTGCSETPTPSVCDDGASCSTDACNPTGAGADATTGCTHTLDNTACTDSFSCTTNTCSPTAVAADPTTGCLVAPQDSACSDSVSCTVDACNPSGNGADAAGCVHQTMNSLCEVDGKSCTVATCNATTGCSETPMDSLCNDNATCTTDSCSPTGPGATGCVNTPNDAVCADTAECSTDACAPGTSGANPTTGCAYTANPAACSSNAMCSNAFDCVCNTGYEGTGLTCTGVMCDPLDDPDNGSVATTNGGLYPSTATYTCDTGYELAGSTTRTCNPDGTWTATEPTCRAITFFVIRVGDGSAALTAASTAVFLEEHDVTGALIRTIALPTAANGNNAPFTMSGTATAEGGLSRSANGAYVTLGGYAAAPGVASINGTSNLLADATPMNRVIARVAADGTVDTSTRLLDAFSTSSIRGVASSDGNAFWASGNSGSGSTGGVHYVTLGSTGTTVRVSGTQNNLRHAHVFGGQVYVSSAAGNTTRGVLAVGSGLPTMAGQVAAQVAPFPSTLSANSFAVLDLNPVVTGPDTIYLAFDQAGVAGTANVQKWTFDGTAWTQATFAPTLTGTVVPNALGLATWLEGTAVHIIVSTNEGSTSRLIDIVDNGTTTTPAATVLTTAPTNTAFRGVARSPTP